MSRQKCLISLTRGKYAIVDPEDYDRVNKFKWCIHNYKKKHYAHRTIYKKDKQKNMVMHRFIMKAKKGEEVHHINNDGLDNRKKNLHKCSKSEHRLTYSKYIKNGFLFKGIRYDKRCKNRFCARIGINRKSINLGCFDNEVEAAFAYDEKLRKLGYKHSRYNFKKVLTQRQALNYLKRVKTKTVLLIYKKIDGEIKYIYAKYISTNNGKNKAKNITVKDMANLEIKSLRLNGILCIGPDGMNIYGDFYYVKRD